MIDLALDDAGVAIHDAVARFCVDVESEALAREGRFSREAWRRLAELGVLALTTPEGEGGAQEMVAALEALGAAAFPGPLPAHFLAIQVLPADARAAASEGGLLVSLGVPPLMPFAPVAAVFLVWEADGSLRLAEPEGATLPVGTLGGEPWGRVALSAGRPLPAPSRAFALHDLVHGAYATALAGALLDAAVEHARTRVQFGRPIGTFQAVAHPLADCRMALDAAATLAHRAACAFDAAPDAAVTRADAAAARLSARDASLHTAHVAHQAFGAIGITTEGPAFHRSRRIRQLASQGPAASEDAAREALLERALEACA